MVYPLLCAVDGGESLLIADSYNHRLQLMDRRGGFSLVGGLDVKDPWDVVIVGKDLFVLHGLPADNIQRYKLC